MSKTLGLSLKNFKSHKLKRLLAFVIDVLILLCIFFITYNILGLPDYPAVKLGMDHLNALQGTPQAQAAADTVFREFNSVYLHSLIIWFIYELVVSIILKGSTIGKLICNIRIVGKKSGEFSPKTIIRLAIRSLVKMLFLFFLQGLPFLISSLSIFANPEFRTGVDYFAGTKPVDRQAQVSPEACEVH
ncbi:MAG: RDD family protein [Clostridiales Family XIII bacterium]|jgi:uncharacterized RDD family membrane protein YckC|nr:RDD family protein [Clostridiales Family XIII bacterium]